MIEYSREGFSARKDGPVVPSGSIYWANGGREKKRVREETGPDPSGVWNDFKEENLGRKGEG